VRVPVRPTRVLHYVSNKFKVSTAFWFWVNRRRAAGQIDRRTRSNTSPARYKRVAQQEYALAAGASRYTVTAACSACYLNANILHANAKYRCPRKKCCISIKPPSTKWYRRRSRAICSQGWVNFNLKWPLSESRCSLSQSCNKIHEALPVLQARLKSGAPFLSYSQKVFFQKKTNIERICFLRRWKCIWRYKILGSKIFDSLCGVVFSVDCLIDLTMSSSASCLSYRWYYSYKAFC